MIRNPHNKGTGTVDEMWMAGKAKPTRGSGRFLRHGGDSTGSPKVAEKALLLPTSTRGRMSRGVFVIVRTRNGI